jgi:hypothetical protein
MVASSETAGAVGAVQVVEVEDGCGEGIVDLPAPAGRDVTADQAGGRRCGRDQEDLDPLDRDDRSSIAGGGWLPSAACRWNF